MPLDRPSRPGTDSRADSETGDRISADAIVESIRAAPMPVVNTRFLAGERGVRADEMFERLESMAEDGVLETHEIEGRGRLWWLSLEAERAADSKDASDGD